jgi:hypothetical protein
MRQIRRLIKGVRMDREQFKTLAAGKYAMSNLESTIDKKEMLAFVEGATFAYDLLNKKSKGGDNETKKTEVEQSHYEQTHQTHEQKTE